MIYATAFQNFAGFLALYVTYVAVALIGRYINQKHLARKKLTELWEEEEGMGGSINDPTPDTDNEDERAPLLSTPAASQISLV